MRSVAIVGTLSVRFASNTQLKSILPFSGLDSTFGGLEAMITGLCDEYPALLGRRRELFVAVLLVFIYLGALPTTTYVSLIKSLT